MKFFLDLLPVVVFVVAYWLSDFYVATAAMVMVALMHFVIAHFTGVGVSKMQAITLGLLILFGGMTLVFRDESFVMWKPTVVNWLFALGFLVLSVSGKQPLLKRMMAGQLELPETAWRKLNFSWILFFLLAGTLNLYVAFGYRITEDDLSNAQLTLASGFFVNRPSYVETVLNTSWEQLSPEEVEQVNGLSEKQLLNGYLGKLHMDFWVNFKLFGLTGMSLLFVLVQFFILYYYTKGL